MKFFKAHIIQDHNPKRVEMFMAEDGDEAGGKIEARYPDIRFCHLSEVTESEYLRWCEAQ